MSNDKECNENTRLNDQATNIHEAKNVIICGKDLKVKHNELTALVLLSSYFFLAYIYFSLFLPFFPGVAKSKGLNQVEIGSVFSVYQLIKLTVSPIFGKFIDVIGVKFLFLGGLFISSSTVILFGALDECPEEYYLVMVLLVRGMTAVGCSMGLSFAIVGNFFPNNVSTIVAIIEMFSGFGLMIGPVIGGMLYQIGGFQMPFFFIGGIQFILFIAAWIFFPKSKSSNQTSNVEETSAYSILPLLKIPRFLLTLLILFSGAISINFIEPSIELHLKPLNLSPLQLGLVFFIPALIYILITPLIGMICDKFPKSIPLIIISSALFSIVSYSLMGPVPILKLPLTLNTFLIGYTLFGISFSGLVIPIYAELIDSACSHGYPNDIRTKGIISGIFASVYSSGALIGPLGGGMVIDAYGFELATFIVVIYFIIVGTLYTTFYLFNIDNKNMERTQVNLSQEP